jgi:hypothetical protein
MDNLNRLSTFLLGQQPWTKESLKKAYFRDFIRTREAIKEHSGYMHHAELSNLRLSFDIFSDAVASLFDSIDTFKSEENTEGFWFPVNRARIAQLELAIRRGMFSATISAMALVDMSRNAIKKIPIDDYQEKIKEVFLDNPEHHFVQELRNYICHNEMVRANWQVSYPSGGRKTIRFIVYSRDLLAWKNWNALSRKFISDSEPIDIEKVFTSYREQVARFQKWFQQKIELAGGASLKEYREFEQFLNGIDAQCCWNLILSQAIPQKIDPYKYLHQYLNKNELVEIYLLPKQSKVQVDRIIKLIDEYNACDDELRYKIYTLFGVIVEA